MPDSQPDYHQEPPAFRPHAGTSHMPTCPLCSTHDKVQRTPRDEAIAERCPFTCGSCWTVFVGTDQEWQRTRDDREAYASVRARLAKIEGVA